MTRKPVSISKPQYALQWYTWARLGTISNLWCAEPDTEPNWGWFFWFVMKMIQRFDTTKGKGYILFQQAR